MNQANYRKLISSQSSGLCAGLLRFFLEVAAIFYLIVVRLRNFLYSKGWLKTRSVNAAVISIGNITTGGTGKTPLVIWLCKFLQNKNISCAVLTRGYKTHTKRRQTTDDRRQTKIDEPAILSESCPEARVIVNPNRVIGANEAVNKFGAKVIIMDDGFQHRRLNRDLDIVTIDSTLPFGYGKMLPAGLLREPVGSLRRANAAIITRCDQTTEPELSKLEEKLRLVNPDMIIARSIHKPTCVKRLTAENAETTEKKVKRKMDSCPRLESRTGLRRNDSIEELKGKRIFAFCGIGNPGAFLSTIKKLGLNLAGSKVYNDHHHYTDDDIIDIYEQAEHSKADLILTTQKDWYSEVRSQKSEVRSQKSEDRIQFAYLVVELKFIAGEDKITQLIKNAIEGKILKK